MEAHAQFNPAVRELYKHLIKKGVRRSNEPEPLPHRYVGAGRYRPDVLPGTSPYYPLYHPEMALSIHSGGSHIHHRGEHPHNHHMHGGRHIRPRHHALASHHMQGGSKIGNFFKNIGHKIKSAPVIKDIHEFVNEDLRRGASDVAHNPQLHEAFHDIVVPVAKEIAKEELKAAVTGAGRRRGRANKSKYFVGQGGAMSGGAYIGPDGHGYGPMHSTIKAPRVTKSLKELIMMHHPHLIPMHTTRGGKIKWKEIGKKISGAFHSVGNQIKAPGGDQNFWKDFGHGLATGVGRSLQYGAVPLGAILGGPQGAALGALGAVAGKNLANKYGVAGMGRMHRAKLPRSGHKRNTARGDIVRAVMSQQGLSLPQASKYVKAHGLY